MQVAIENPANLPNAMNPMVVSMESHVYVRFGPMKNPWRTPLLESLESSPGSTNLKTTPHVSNQPSPKGEGVSEKVTRSLLFPGTSNQRIPHPMVSHANGTSRNVVY